MKQKLVVIKIGGNVIDNPELLNIFLKAFSKIKSPKILVHGGGKIATEIAEKLGLETTMHEGRRITDKPMLDVVTMVYGGLINKNIVALLNANNCKAIGLTGADGGIIIAKKRHPEPIDFGFVGDIKQVDSALITSLLAANLTPVFAPLTANTKGEMLNTNADTQAQAIAVAMSHIFETELVFCFEKNGVLTNSDDENSVIDNLVYTDYQNLKLSGAIFKGMIPKLDNAFKAIEDGVKSVRICHAKNLNLIIENQKTGTIIQ
jgi:acetylglutamate kinase